MAADCQLQDVDMNSTTGDYEPHLTGGDEDIEHPMHDLREFDNPGNPDHGDSSEFYWSNISEYLDSTAEKSEENLHCVAMSGWSVILRASFDTFCGGEPYTDERLGVRGDRPLSRPGVEPNH